MALFSRRPKKDDKALGEHLYAKGQWAQALEVFERLAAGEPNNVKLLRRVADLRAKLGRRAEAVEAYRQVADHYADEGFLVQAIAIFKVLLRLDPSAEDVGRRLADLYAKRGIGSQAEGGSGSGAGGPAALPETPLFSDLDPEAFRQVLDRLMPRTLGMGQTLFREGDPGDSIFIVTSGAVRVTRGNLALAELGEGAFFGEAAFFSHQPRNADVVAVSPAELLEIRRQDMESLMAQHPGVASAMQEFYRRRVLDGVLAASPVFGTLPADERKKVADRFTLLQVRAGEVVVREGDAERSLYLVKRGRFTVTTAAPGGGENVNLAELGPGDFFGEVALVGGTRRTATVTAAAQGELLQSKGEDLDPVLTAHPELRKALEKTRDERAAATIAIILGKRP